MPTSLENLFEEALSMPRESRVDLAERLIRSLDQDDRGELSPEWATEIRRRIDAYRRGEMKVFPADEVMRSLPACSYRPSRARSAAE